MKTSLKKIFKNWGVVQLAERVAVNHEVAGSSPAAPAKHTKGENMSETTNRQNKKELNHLRDRISDLVDELSILKAEMRRFKDDVASDVKYLTERVDQ
jgi:hypothetical protein